MKKLFIVAAVVAATSFQSFAQVSFRNYPSVPSTTVPSSTRYQSGYMRSDGTLVNGHFKTQSNKTNLDNFSTKGNVNAYTGTQGSRARDYSPGAYNYGAGKIIHNGSRGGQYYINSNGNKTYVPKRW